MDIIRQYSYNEFLILYVTTCCFCCNHIGLLNICSHVFLELIPLSALANEWYSNCIHHVYIVSANRVGIPTFSAFGSEAGLHGSYNTVNQRSERNIDVGWFVCIVIVLILAGDLRNLVALCIASVYPPFCLYSSICRPSL